MGALGDDRGGGGAPGGGPAGGVRRGGGGGGGLAGRGGGGAGGRQAGGARHAERGCHRRRAGPTPSRQPRAREPPAGGDRGGQRQDREQPGVAEATVGELHRDLVVRPT